MNIQELKEQVREEFNVWMEKEYAETGGEIGQCDFLDKVEEITSQVALAVLQMVGNATSLNGNPATTEYANGWNDCRKAAYEARKEQLDAIAASLKQTV